ncbi:MAG TPA: sulfite exporter TauE/SafE family protein [bacterium]|nr:sulfite exporter TauE/SafE family protein [bacterium]
MPLDARFVLFGLLVLTAKAVEAVTGFGSTIIALTLGAQMYPIETLLPVLVPLNIVLSTYIVARHRAGVVTDVLFKRILPLAGVGLAVGMGIFAYTHGRTLKLAYGIFVLLISAYELQRILRAKDAAEAKPMSFVQSAFWLISGGIIQGIYASGGPLIVKYASVTLTDKKQFRSTLSVLWLVLNIVLLVDYVRTGKVTAATLEPIGLLLPALFLGIVIGEWLHHRIPERAFRIFVFALLIVAGLSLVFKA